MLIFIAPALKAQEVLLKGDNVSMINVYGDYRLSSVPLKKTPKKQVSSYSAKGYRILLYRGQDKETAYQMQSDFRSKYDFGKLGVQFDAPNFYVKTGEFLDRNDADFHLEKIQADFPDAVIVPDQITVQIK